MTDAERLLAAFDDGTLVRPSAGALNLVDLARALASIAGVPDVALADGAREIASAIGEPRHVVFMLVDGLGANMLAAERGATFLNAHTQHRLQTVFPATTSVALTSLATVEWPARHAVTGWWTHLPAIGAAATVLPYLRPLGRPAADGARRHAGAGLSAAVRGGADGTRDALRAAGADRGTASIRATGSRGGPPAAIEPWATPSTL